MRTLIGIIGIAILSLSGVLPAQEFHLDIPKAWDDHAVKDLELPLVQRDRSPRYLTADEYYKLRVRPIYRTYLCKWQGAGRALVPFIRPTFRRWSAYRTLNIWTPRAWFVIARSGI